MDEYIYSRMSPISLARKVLKKEAAKCLLDESEKSQLRGVLATLTWVGREGRPDAAAGRADEAPGWSRKAMASVRS